MAVNVSRTTTPRATGRATGKVRLSVAGIASILLLIFLAIGAFFGGWEQMHPAADGSGMGMPLEYLKNSPFTSYFVPGVLLFAVFGVGSVVAALAGILRHWSAPYLTFALGVGQMIWITVEFLMVQVFHPVLHLALFAWGVVATFLAYVWHRGNAAAA